LELINEHCMEMSKQDYSASFMGVGYDTQNGCNNSAIDEQTAINTAMVARTDNITGTSFTGAQVLTSNTPFTTYLETSDDIDLFKFTSTHPHITLTSYGTVDLKVQCFSSSGVPYITYDQDDFLGTNGTITLPTGYPWPNTWGYYRVQNTAANTNVPSGASLRGKYTITVY